MARFSLKRLFIAITLIATGFAVLSYFWSHLHDRLNIPEQLGFFVAMAFLFLPGFLIGAGVFSLCRRPVLTAVSAGIICGIIGTLVQIGIGMTQVFPPPH
jgi:hypothetical protein